MGTEWVEISARTDASSSPISGDTNQLQKNINEVLKGGAPWTPTTTPGTNPPAGKLYIYIKADLKWYCLDEDGVETEIGGGGSPLQITLTLSGNAVVGTNQISFISPVAGTLSKVWIQVGTAPTDASLIVDVNKNRTTIFTDQDKRPILASNEHYVESDTPDVTSVAAKDIISIDVDQIGSTVSGGIDLWIIFTITPS